MKAIRTLAAILMAATMMSMVFVFDAFAVDYPSSTPTQINIAESSYNLAVITRADETEWIYDYDAYGRLIKRLWSYTYAKWLTDWMLV